MVDRSNDDRIRPEGDLGYQLHQLVGDEELLNSQIKNKQAIAIRFNERGIQSALDLFDPEKFDPYHENQDFPYNVFAEYLDTTSDYTFADLIEFFPAHLGSYKPNNAKIVVSKACKKMHSLYLQFVTNHIDLEITEYVTQFHNLRVKRCEEIGRSRIINHENSARSRETAWSLDEVVHLITIIGIIISRDFSTKSIWSTAHGIIYNGNQDKVRTTNSLAKTYRFYAKRYIDYLDNGYKPNNFEIEVFSVFDKFGVYRSNERFDFNSIWKSILDLVDEPSYQTQNAGKLRPDWRKIISEMRKTNHEFDIYCEEKGIKAVTSALSRKLRRHNNDSK